MKGIILAGGRGTRLYPITRAVSKQLLPIYDKPMVYFPLCTLLESGISDILIITAQDSLGAFKELLGDGSQLGISLSYMVQPFALGIADALAIGREFIGSGNCALILGDNLFVHSQMSCLLKSVNASNRATVFAIPVSNPGEFGVIEMDGTEPVSIEEKPKHPKSDLAVTGLYFYPPNCVSMVDNLEPSGRGEYEITDLNRLYLDQGKLDVKILPSGTKWLDTGTCAGMLEAINFVAAVRKSGSNCGCIEETAVKMGLIPPSALEKLAGSLTGTEYGKYLLEASKWQNSNKRTLMA